MNKQAYSKYLECIAKQLESPCENWTFKSDNEYRSVLEHVSFNDGILYLQELENIPLFNNNKNLFIELSINNDKYGNPNKSVFDNFITCSPTNLRYILHSFLILQHAVDHNLNNIDFIEIGGGYGGLCYMIHNISKLFNISINSYTILDLYEASLLQQKYLHALKIDNVLCSQLECNNDYKNNSFLISNYAFSEISKDLQDEYISKVIKPYVTHGYLVWNFIPVYHFVPNSVILECYEYPQTGYGANRYVKFFPKN